MGGERIEGILNSLTSGREEIGWAQFLDFYTEAIRQTISQYENDAIRSRDCFDFVCAKLSDNGFRRLTAFRPDGPARFRTWLTAVVANLCVDWRRSVDGRFRVPGAIRELSEKDRLVFDCFYRQGLSYQECLNFLRTKYARITIAQISEINSRLHETLKPRQRWQLSTSRYRATELNVDEIAVPAEAGQPATLAELQQDRELVQKALSCLEPDSRLCLQLRYEQGLTLDEVARLMSYKDPFEARRRVEAALKAFAKALKL